MHAWDYRTSVFSQVLGFNTSSLSSLNINITSTGETFLYTTASVFHNIILHIPTPILCYFIVDPTDIPLVCVICSTQIIPTVADFVL